jgi:hypothetical protein
MLSVVVVMVMNSYG